MICNCCCVQPAVRRAIKHRVTWNAICQECLDHNYPDNGNYTRACYFEPDGEELPKIPDQNVHGLNDTLEIENEYKRTMRDVEERFKTALLRMKTRTKVGHIVQSQQMYIRRMELLQNSFAELSKKPLS